MRASLTNLRRKDPFLHRSPIPKPCIRIRHKKKEVTISRLIRSKPHHHYPLMTSQFDILHMSQLLCECKHLVYLETVFETFISRQTSWKYHSLPWQLRPRLCGLPRRFSSWWFGQRRSCIARIFLRLWRVRRGLGWPVEWELVICEGESGRSCRLWGEGAWK